jgi:hypothetical protein
MVFYTCKLIYWGGIGRRIKVQGLAWEKGETLSEK